MKYLLCFIVFLFLVGTAPTAAQTTLPTTDVCCYGLQSSGDGNYAPFAGPKAKQDCKKGATGFRSGQKICGFNTNLDNCAYMKLPQICKACGKHWLADLGKCSDKTLEELVPEKESSPATTKDKKMKVKP